MVKSYAESFDVSRDVASAALRFQDEMLPMIDDLAERWPDVFSNARFVNGREYALIIALAGPALDVADAARAHARSRGHEESRVSFETAPLSLNQINAASELVSKNLEGVEHEVSFSHETGRFTIRSESPTNTLSGIPRRSTPEHTSVARQLRPHQGEHQDELGVA